MNEHVPRLHGDLDGYSRIMHLPVLHELMQLSWSEPAYPDDYEAAQKELLRTQTIIFALLVGRRRFNDPDTQLIIARCILAEERIAAAQMAHKVKLVIDGKKPW